MRIGFHTTEKDPRNLVFYCRSLGVERVCLSCEAIEIFHKKGVLEASHLTPFKRILNEFGIDIGAMIAPLPSAEALKGEPVAEEEIKKLCKTIEAIGESEIDTVLFYPLDRTLFPRDRSALVTFILGEGGRYSLESLEENIRPDGKQWPAVICFFQRIVETAERSNVKLANHVWDIHYISEILKAVPSRYNGLTYCPGMYIIGGDPYGAINYFGVSRIFLAHVRNLVKHGKRFKDYEEVFLDEGDIDISRCIELLKEIGYRGMIIPEHLGPPSDRELLPKAIQYLKRYISS
ncbi:MAG: TIM barrel protein [Candidatus Bathyarchaeia archaeon]